MMGSKSDQFVNDLIQFYRNRGSHNPQPQQFVARINGKIVNLSELYSHVLENGGSFRVNQSNLWDDIYCKLFKTPFSGANISVALRQIYSRYLLPYEKTFSSNFGSDLLDDDEDDSHFSFNSSHNHSFNSQTSNFPITPYSQYTQIASNTVNESVKPINKLFCSLLSGLPNELDFALKVSTILINSNRFDWSSDSKYINLLLESTKIYCCICDEEKNEISLESDTICMENESNLNGIEKRNCNCYKRFWYQCCNNEQVLELVFGPRDSKLDEIPPHLFLIILQRIRLIADIIRNVSFTYDCQESASSQSSASVGGMTGMLKFLLLLMMSEETDFNNIALDILSNIAPATAFIHDDSEYSLIQQCIHRHCIQIAMISNNIHCTGRCLEIVSRLLSSNVEELNSTLESYLIEYEVFVRITQLMTCQYDITLLLAVLEFCLALSEQKPYMLVNEDNKYLIKILLTLLNCESSQHFTTSALKRMKIIDDRPRTQLNCSNETNSSQPTVSTQIVNSQNAITQSNSIDNETFALNWLRTTYEPTTVVTQSQSLKSSDLYADYVKYCCRSSRRNVIAAQSFSQLIMRCFPSCSITNNHTLIEGIIAKPITTQTKSNQLPASQVMSPILKAHLSAPPKNNSISTNTTIATNSNSNTNCSNNQNNSSTNGCSTSSPKPITSITPITTSISIPTTNTSTLIKSLLANKLRSNATVSTTAITSTPNKSTVNTNICTNTTPILTAITTTPSLTASYSGTNESNSESVTISSAQLSSPLTITPSISLSPTNTIISTSNANLSSQTIQPQQQFLLVRTIITGQQQSGCTGLTTTGTPVRLILPASMLTQQRFTNPTVNGISTTSSPLNSVTISASNNTNNTNNSVTYTSNTASTDLFLKTVLSGSNSSNSVPVTPLRSNVKSSPLLNVLLDKGKLPDFTGSTVLNNQLSANSFGNTATLMQPQGQKMFILTTKSPLAIKSLPALQTQQTQCLQQQSLSSMCTPMQTQNSLQSFQTSSAFLTNSTVTVTTFTTTPTTSTSTNHSKLSNIPKISMTSTMNGELSSPLNTINTVNAINTVNTGTLFKTSSLNTIPASDLSSIKDMKKAVDDATKLISKRRNEEESVAINKKPKINCVLANPSCTASQINCVNHDSNSNSSVNSDTNSNSNANTVININSNTNTNPQQQVLTKTSSLLTTTTTTPTVTSINTSNNNNDNNNKTNNNCNIINSNNNNSSVHCNYECQWNDCKKTFVRAAEVFLHVYNHHIMPSTFPNVMTCLWGGQEGTGPGCLSKRPKLSLLTHLLDFHCNSNVLQQEIVRKKQLCSVGSTSITLQQPPAHPGYAQNAALLAIRRHATNYVEPPTLPPINKLTPLTVSIRLTAALILRNLAQHSSFVKRTLECFEQYLCELCMSDGRDESRTIAQCLAVINDKK